MNTGELKEVMTWLKGTDLVEVSYKENDRGFSLTTAEAPAPRLTEARLGGYSCVTAQHVGVFQANALGKSKVEEGREVAEGDLLGLIDTGAKELRRINAPCKGVISRIFAEPGQAVQYGQPLFFVDPR